MKSPVMLIVVAVGCLAVGAGVDRVLLSGGASDRKADSRPQPLAIAAPAENHATSERDLVMESLRKQVAELERSLSLRMEQIAELQQAIARRDDKLAGQATSSVPVEVRAEVAGERPERRQPRESFEARLERLRTEAPEEYTEMQRRREEMQQRMTQLHQDRRSFLDAIDTARMSEEQRENHAKLVAAIDAANAFRLQVSSGDWSQVSAEQRAEGFNSFRTIGELYEQERRYLLEETGRTYGEDGDRFADYIENVLENTSMMPAFGRGGGRRREGGATQPTPGEAP